MPKSTAAKLKGEGMEDEETAGPDRGNVVDLMAALKKSLGQGGEAPAKAPHAPKGETKPAAKAPKKRAAVAPAPKPARKRA